MRYRIVDGRAPFLRLLGEVELALAGVVALSEVTAIGLTCASINGGISFSANCTDNEGLRTSIPAEFCFPSFLSFDSETSPIKEWSKVYWEGGELLTEGGAIIASWNNNAEFAEPIFRSVCKWMNEIFATQTFQTLRPKWLVVDEVDAGLNRAWESQRNGP